MYISTEPLHLLLFYLRSVLDVFAISALGLQLMGQLPPLGKLFRHAFFIALFFLLVRFIPIGWVSQVSLLFLVLIIFLLRSRMAGFFVSTAAVILGFNVLIHLEWVIVLIRQSFGFVPVHVTRDFIVGLMNATPSLLILLGLVLLVHFLQRARGVPAWYSRWGQALQAVDQEGNTKIIPIAQLFTVLISSHVVNSFYFQETHRLFASTLPFAICLVIVLVAYWRQQQDRPFVIGGYPLYELLEFGILAFYVHSILVLSGGPESPQKLLMILLVVSQALKPGRLTGALALIFSCASLIYLGITMEQGSLVWDLETDLVLMGVFAFTYFFVRYYLSEESRAKSSLQTKAFTDYLTGLYNYHFVHSYLREAAQKLKPPVYVLMIDLDNFKSVNDCFGHPVGDELLKQAARAIRDSVRREDIVARYGGDEFVVIVSEVKQEGKVLELAERIRESVDRSAARFSAGLEREETNEEVPSITASIGVAAGFSPGEIAELISQADQAMYEAKNQGKNGVVLREHQQEGGVAADFCR